LAGIKNKIILTYEESHKMIEGSELQKKCSIHEIYCQEESPWFPCTDEYFYKVKNKTDCLSPWCKKCSSLKAREWAKENPEKEKELRHKINTNPSEKTRETKRADAQTRRDNGKYYQWLKDNPDKQRVYGEKHRIHDITEKEWQACLEFFDYKCAYCGITLREHLEKEKQSLHKEHVDDNGYNDLRNCVPACRRCNSGKHIFDLEEWHRKQKFFSTDRLIEIIWWTVEGYKKYIEDKLPYRIVKKRNEHNKKFHWELWSVDELRNMVECIDIKDKKDQLDIGLIDKYHSDKCSIS